MKNLRKPLELDSLGRVVLPKNNTSPLSSTKFKDNDSLDEEELAFFQNTIERSELVSFSETYIDHDTEEGNPDNEL